MGPAVKDALARLADGDLAGALSLLASADQNDAWVRGLKAECLEKQGRMEAAIAELDAAIALDPSMAALHEFRGHCLFQRKDYEAAAAAFTAGLKLAPENASLLRRRADSRWLAGDLKGAEADLARCRELEPAALDHRLAWARLRLLSGRDRGLLAELTRLEKSEMPGAQAGARYLKGVLHFKRKRYLRAAAEFEAAEERARQGAFPGRFIDAGYSAMAKGFEFMSGKRKAAKGRAGKGELILTGMGLDYPYQATLEALKVLSECDIVVNNLAGAEAMEFLSLFCDDVRTISFEGAYSRNWAEKIFTWIKPGLKVAFVTRGHPLVSGHLALTLLQKAKAEAVAVRCYGALSSVDQVLALTQEVLSETWWGLQVLDSQLLLAGSVAVETKTPLLLYLSSTPDLAALAARLGDAYAGAQRVLVFGPRYDQRRFSETTIAGLRAFLAGVEPRMVSSLILLVPPMDAAAPARDRERSRRAEAEL